MKDENLIIGESTKNDSIDENREENEVLVCEHCSGHEFTPVYILIWRKSIFHPELQKDGWAPMQTMKCVECGHINADMDPRNELLYVEGENE